MKTTLLFLATTLLLFTSSCKKDYLERSETEAENPAKCEHRNSQVKVAERVQGVVICTIDEDIIRAAVLDYYGGTSIPKLEIVERGAGSGNSYFVIKGRVKKYFTTIRYAFELVPVQTSNGDLDLFLPVAGTEQRVTGFWGSTCLLNLTSASTGHVAGFFCYGVYAKSTSSTLNDDFGTNRLITKIIDASVVPY